MPLNNPIYDLVLHVLNYKKDGMLVEIGVNHNGFSYSIRDKLTKLFNWSSYIFNIKDLPEDEKNNIVCFPKTKGLDLNYSQIFHENNAPENFDFLSIHTTDYHNTPYILRRFHDEVMGKHKFAIIVFQTNIYNTNKTNARGFSRNVLNKCGYIRIFSDVMAYDENPEWDWYVHPDLVDMNYINSLMEKNEDRYISSPKCWKYFENNIVEKGINMYKIKFH